MLIFIILKPPNYISATIDTFGISKYVPLFTGLANSFKAEN